MKNLYFGLIAFVLFAFASIYITFPLIFHMTNYVTGELVVSWIMNWNIHAIMHGVWAQPGAWQAFFDANIFYPYHNTLAYSDLLLSSSIFALPLFIFVHEPELPSNITFISSLILLGFFTYILVFYLTKNFFASLLSGLLIIFSPVTLDKRFHLQILAIEWVPLALLFFLHFLKTKRYKFLILSLFFFVVQTYNSFMAGYFLVFSYTGVGLSYLVSNGKKIVSLVTKKTILFSLLAFVLIFPIIVPYYQVSHEFSFVRDIRETIHLALQPEDLLVTNETSRLKPILWFFDAKQYPSSAEVKPGFLGLIFTILALVSFTYIFLKQKSKKRFSTSQNDVTLLAFVGVALWGLVLSLGPALHIGRLTIHHPFLIPLPYAIAYYVLPGFQGIRDSSRFEMLFVISIAIVIGIVIDQLLKKRKLYIKTLVWTVLLIAVMGEFVGPINYGSAYTFENFPQVYTWIAKNTPTTAVILEEPVYNWDNNPFGDNREVLREYFSTLHFRKLISGGSGFSPPPWQQFAKSQFANFPSPASVLQVKKYGANYLIVHKGEFDILKKNGDYVLSMLSQNSHLRFIIKEGDDYVYEVK